jgi:hypothetical protein
MSERPTKLGQDDDGNLDDKRVAGWVLFAVFLGLVIYGVAFQSPESAGVTMEYSRMTLWASVTALGIGVVEKFSAKRGG